MGHDVRGLCLISLLCLVTTISFFLPSTCESERVPTLKEIFGRLPKHNLPLKRRDSHSSPSRSLENFESRSFESNSESSLKAAEFIFESLGRGLLTGPSSITAPVSQTGFSPALAGSSEYYVELSIGTPAQAILVILDTGSPTLWVQTQECAVCFPELLHNYDPQISSTFKPLYINGSSTPVPFVITYGDGSVNEGIRARETLTIDSGYDTGAVVEDFVFALVDNSTGLNSLYSGILGMSPGSEFLYQLGITNNDTLSEISGQFRYCFPDRVNQPNATSFVSFGSIDDSEADSLYTSSGQLNRSNTLWTPIVPDEDFYVVNLTGISVAGTRLPIDPTQLGVVPETQTFTILDSGSVLNSFPLPISNLLLDAYTNATTNLAPSNIDGFLGYNLPKDVFDAMVFPSMSFFFQKWHPQGGKVSLDEEIELVMPKDNLLIPYLYTNSSTNISSVQYIVNIVPTSDNMTVIGNFAQENFLIEYDLDKNRVGFLRASCVFD